MYCPKCGQQYVTDARFCSRCGMNLNAVTTLVGTNGLMGAPVENAKVSAAQKRGMRLGAKLMFGGLVLLPPFFGLCFPADNPAPLLVPATVFLAGISLWLYAKLFGGEDIPFVGQPNRSTANREQAYLPPEYVEARPFEVRTANTAETLPPPSVTDHTTKIFDR